MTTPYLREQARASFPFFCAYVLQDSFTRPFTPEQDRLLWWLSEDEGWIDAAFERGSGVTTIVSYAFTLWQVCRSSDRYVVLYRRTEQWAHQLLYSIQEQLVSNPRLIALFGNLLPDARWPTRSFVTTTGVMVRAALAGSVTRGDTFRGNRPQLIIADGLDEPYERAVDRDRMHDWWKRQALPSLGHGGRAIRVSTIEDDRRYAPAPLRMEAASA